MTTRINRRTLAAGLLAASAAPAAASTPYFASSPALRGDDTARLPDHAALWARMPLPFTPAEAWHLLFPATQAEIGAAVIGMALADYVPGDMHDETDHFRDDTLRGDCINTRDALLNLISDRLWSLFPDLYGPDGNHPAGALNSGMAPPAA